MASSTIERFRRWRFAAALLLLAAYALPLFAPPAATPLAPLAPDASLGERLFPGVPAWWVAERLLCLLLAALLIASAERDHERECGAAQNESNAASFSEAFAWVALGLAGLQLIAGCWASHFSRLAQVLYVACLALPPLLLALGSTPAPAPRSRDWRAPAMVAVVVAGWLLLRLPVMWRSARAADLIDTWIGLQHLRRAADPAFNLLTGRFLAGGGSLYLMFQGVGLVQAAGIEPSFQLAQAAQFSWLALAGVLVGLAAARLVGTAAAPVATAALLFSPFAQMMLLTPLALFFGPLMAAGLIMLLVKVHEDRSPPALAGLGAIAGMAATQPSTALTAVAIFCAALWSAARRRLPTHALVLAGLLFAAGVVTGLPDLQTLRSMALTYTRGRAQWVGHEMAGFGQVSAASEYLVEGATPHSFDTAISAVLAPFASPRTPMRLVGDVLFDPITGGLAAVGLAVCLAALARSWRARALVGIFALTIVPGFLSSADRISIIRLFVVPVPTALLAAFGWEVMRRRLGPTRPVIAAAVATVAIAAGGIALFDAVNPRILASSWVTITLQALGEKPPENVVALDHPPPDSFPYWYLGDITRSLSPQPIAVEVAGGGELQTSARLLFWNPGLEEDQHVSATVCRQWPGAALYTLTDRAHQSRIFAARVSRRGWTPAFPDEQWSEQECGAALETEATWAADVMSDARDLIEDGRPDEAADLLRTAARQTFAQASLFEATASALLDSAPSAESKLEAVHWARRAAQVTRFRDAGALSTLAAAYSAAGQLSDALDTARQAKELAAAQGSSDLTVRLEARIREYERASRVGAAP